jgi:non-specific serine/threonine protein kinase
MVHRSPAGDGRHNLPASPTPLIGREQERRVAREQLLLEQIRLLTLTGPGGSGKTRLALAVAEDLVATFADGAWLVDLTPVRESSLVLFSIARAICLRRTGHRPILDILSERLRGQQILLVLDNCEHVLEAAPQIAELLAACRQVKVLAASREPLGLRWEHELPIPALSVPDLRRLADLETLRTVPAVELFVQRAQAVNPTFMLTDENALAVAELCVRLDGLPLALELAAARTRLLSVKAILLRLEHGLAVLTSDARDRPVRHRTLHEAILWSHDLLDDDERAVLRRVSIFVGGWTLEAAEAVAGDGESVGSSSSPITQHLSPNTLDLLGSLTDKSLLRRETVDDDEPRFGMLETIREFAHEQLQIAGEVDETARRHAEYHLALVERAAPRLYTDEQQTWLHRLGQESPNVRAALAWGRSTPSATEIWTRLATALGWFWWLHDELREGRQWLELVVATIRPDSGSPIQRRIRTNALNTAGMLARGQGDYERAIALLDAGLRDARRAGDRREIAWPLVSRAAVALDQGDSARGMELNEEAIAICRDLGEHWMAGLALYFLGFMARGSGEYERATACQEESLALRRAIGDTWGIAWSLHDLGLVALGQRDYPRAQVLLSESLAMLRQLSHQRGVAWSLTDLGAVALATGDIADARALLAEGLVLRREQGDKRGIAESLEYLAATARAGGDAARGARMLGAAATLREAIGAPRWPTERARQEQERAAARRAIGDARFDVDWDERRNMTFESAVAEALSLVAAPSSDLTVGDGHRDQHAPLTPRELEVGALIVRGASNRKIAEALVISPTPPSATSSTSWPSSAAPPVRRSRPGWPATARRSSERSQLCW